MLKTHIKEAKFKDKPTFTIHFKEKSLLAIESINLFIFNKEG